jgi:hypothetical protein
MNCGRVLKEGTLGQSDERKQANRVGTRAYANAPKALTVEQLDIVAATPKGESFLTC